jgi:hypothetical protein
VIAYKPMDADPYIPSNFVFDKYEVFGVELCHIEFVYE